MAEIQALNKLCCDLLGSTERAVQQAASEELHKLQESPECLQKCLMLLDQGESSFAPVVACSSLSKLVTQKKVSVSIEERLELRNYLISFLWQRAPRLETFAVTAVCQLVARLTKQGWDFQPDDDNERNRPFRTPIWELLDKIKSKDQMEERLLSLQILKLLVAEMSSDEGEDSLSVFRRKSADFRDGILERIFQTTLTILDEYVVNASQIQEKTMPLIDECLDLIVDVAEFNFLGTSEERGDDQSTHIPSCWKALFLEGGPINAIFPLYSKLPSSFAPRVLAFGAQMVAVRRTLFDPKERHVYVDCIMRMTCQIMASPEHLGNSAAFHQFTRLVNRLRLNFQFQEIVTRENYERFIEGIAELTCQTFMARDVSGNSVLYLLEFWAKMTSALPVSKCEGKMNIYGPQIYRTFVAGKLEHVESIVKGEIEDPLEDETSVIIALEHLSYIPRTNYTDAFACLTSFFEQNIQVLQNVPEQSLEGKVAKERLTWLVLFMGSAIYGAVNSGARPTCEHEKHDGEMSSKCFNLMLMSDQGLVAPAQGQSAPPNGSRNLEIAFVYFLDCFRKVYMISGSRMQCVVYESLMPELNISCEKDATTFMAQKICNNLEYWGKEEAILDLTLDLFKDLANGYTAVRRLMKIDKIQMLLKNHTNLPFLATNVPLNSMKTRTKFYDSLARVLFVDVKEEETEVVESFLVPFIERVEMIEQNKVASVEEMQRLIAALFRDIRGIAGACSNKLSYHILYTWAYPRLFKIMLCCVQEWPAESEILIPLFRLLEEFVQNRYDRLKFEMNEAAGVCLFKEASTIICAYAENYLNICRTPCPESELYSRRYKVVACVFRCIRNIIHGNYVPHGILRMFEDRSWDNMLLAFVNLAATIPDEAYELHHKVADAYYGTLDYVVSNNMAFISKLPADKFLYMLGTIRRGIAQKKVLSETNPITSSCSAIETIVQFIFNRVSQRRTLQHVGSETFGDDCIQAIHARPEALSEIMETVFSAIVLSEVKCQWSLCRPLLGLVLLQEDVFKSLIQRVINTFTLDRREAAARAFDGLMDNVTRSLQPKDKDNFGSNVQKMVHKLQEIRRNPPATASFMKTGSHMA